MKKCKKDLDQQHEKLDKHNECNAKLFLVAKGQCNLSMKNELEAMKKHRKLEKNDNAVGPLKMTKELSCVSTEVKCQCWSMMTMLSESVNARQGDNKTMAVHCKRFKNVVDVVEGQWGESHSEKVAKNELDYGDETKCQAVTDGCNEKFLTCVFMHRANRKSHKNCIGELNNVCLSGSDRCPKSVEAVVTHMSHHMDQN